MLKRLSRTIKAASLTAGLAGGLFVFLSGAATAANETGKKDLTGLWLTKKKDTVVEIRYCNDNSLCGRIHWLAPDVVQKDSANPDKSLRQRPLCGIRVLWGFQQNNNNPALWEHGKIYKADDGETFRASLRLTEPDKLKLRGYVALPIFGKSHVLTRTDAQSYPDCAAQDKHL